MTFKNSLKSIFILSLIFSVQFSAGVNAQVFNFDFLTFNDHTNRNADKTRVVKATCLFTRATKDFDATGKTLSRISSIKEFYVYITLPFLIRNQFSIFISPQLGFVVPSNGIMTYTWGIPWIWTKYRLLQNLPIELRAGFKFGKLGEILWREDNEVDIGFLSSISMNQMFVDGTLSYRIRSPHRPKYQTYGFSGRNDKNGDELHYKLKLSNKFSDKTILSIFVLGYVSKNKELENKTLPDSYSRKSTLGFSVNYQPNVNRNIGLSFLYDVAGRYDNKIAALVFNLTEKLKK